MKVDSGLTFHSLPWLLGWVSLSVIGPLVFLKVVYKTCILALYYVSNRSKYINGKIVLITGASSGLGEALAHTFYKKGCRLILASRNITALEKLKETMIKQYRPSELHIPTIEYLDLEDLNSIPKLADKIIKNHGHIDVLVNNAGISNRGEIVSTDISVDLKVMLINYFGHVALTKAILKDMIARQKGHIIAMSSIQGKVSIPLRSSYGASKHALQSFFDCLRAEVSRHNINVTVVSPSYIRTNLSYNAVTATGERYGELDDNTKSGMSPEYVAERITKCLITKESDVVLGPYVHKIAIFLQSNFPSIFSFIMKLKAKKDILALNRSKSD